MLRNMRARVRQCDAETKLVTGVYYDESNYNAES